MDLFHLSNESEALRALDIVRAKSAVVTENDADLSFITPTLLGIMFHCADIIFRVIML